MYVSANIFYSIVIYLQTILFPYFSVFFLFVLNITIAFLNYFSKNPLNITIATVYFVDIRSTLLILIVGSDWCK